MAIPGNLLSATTESIDPNTSGWTSKTNCTISKGSGGRNGDGVLAVKSVASGEMQARTVSSYPVAEGLLYYTFADASGATVPERIGIRWLTAAGAEISVSWSLTTAAASASWHRISVAQVAPVGATQAQVLLSSTPAAAAVFSYYENVYFGAPIRSSGNLYGFNAESSEVDATGWAVESNCTISRQVPVTTWSVDWYYAGGHTMAMTVTANGNAAMRTVDRPAVTAGTEYLAYIYLNPPTSGSTAWIELRFYDASNVQLQATRATLAAPGTGYYRQLVSDIAPAGAVTCGITVGLDSATAGQILRVDTAVARVMSAVMAGTVVPYASSSFEQSAGGWTVASGVATIARSTPWGAASYLASYSLAVASATATASTLRSPKFVLPNAAGLHWRSQVALKVNAGSWSGVLLRLHWYDASNVDLGTSTGTAYVLPAGGWYALSHGGDAPAGTAKAELELVLTAGASSSSLWMDGAALWQALPVTDADAVSDGGYVILTLRELTVDYLLTVSRVTPDGTRTLVRGPSGLTDKVPITADTLVFEDHEAPLNTDVYYWVEIYTAAGVLASTRNSPVVSVVLDDVNEAWLKDPGNPQRNVKVLVRAAPEWSLPITQTAHKIRNRQNAVILSDSRGGLEGNLTVWTRSDDERKALRVLLGPGNTLLWQTAPGLGEDENLYVSVGSAGLARAGGVATDAWRSWTLPLTQADMPVTTGVNGAAGRTWQDVLTEFATWQDVLDTYATWEDVWLDRRK
ncbi:hypothetical protein PYK79_31770 [Streptomyces sp. ID05-04B]|uniref:hypothetical protein n=1 Tax=Streptomyces sp. ID05-04B TaxID=3028661 RepID=UPI0029C39D9C|nr:hypothetical protein [Streptomyces sp. ID05-04B]MDX5566912.1 hypothetical protein [Streptomyces sp. ID05-04B]